MNNFKSGSGDLDFGSEPEDTDVDPDRSETQNSDNEEDHRGSSQSSDSNHGSTNSPKSQSRNSSPSLEKQHSPTTSTEDTPAEGNNSTPYPYFVRRKNVGDERDARLELHVREKVIAREPQFRSNLAEHLGTSEVSKTDAREFALLAAFDNPERVADLMEEEGYGMLD